MCVIHHHGMATCQLVSFNFWNKFCLIYNNNKMCVSVKMQLLERVQNVTTPKKEWSLQEREEGDFAFRAARFPMKTPMTPPSQRDLPPSWSTQSGCSTPEEVEQLEGKDTHCNSMSLSRLSSDKPAIVTSSHPGSPYIWPACWYFVLLHHSWVHPHMLVCDVLVTGANVLVPIAPICWLAAPDAFAVSW